VTNRGFLLWVSNTVISQWTSNLNGDWTEKLQTQGNCFLKECRSVILGYDLKREEGTALYHKIEEA
jgi:hypothetical protein